MTNLESTEKYYGTEVHDWKVLLFDDKDSLIVERPLTALTEEEVSELALNYASKFPECEKHVFERWESGKEMHFKDYAYTDTIHNDCGVTIGDFLNRALQAGKEHQFDPMIIPMQLMFELEGKQFQFNVRDMALTYSDSEEHRAFVLIGPEEDLVDVNDSEESEEQDSITIHVSKNIIDIGKRIMEFLERL